MISYIQEINVQPLIIRLDDYAYICVCVKFRKDFFKKRTMVNENSEQVTLQALSHLCDWKVIMAVAAKKRVL